MLQALVTTYAVNFPDFLIGETLLFGPFPNPVNGYAPYKNFDKLLEFAGISMTSQFRLIILNLIFGEILLFGPIVIKRKQIKGYLTSRIIQQRYANTPQRCLYPLYGALL